MKIYIHVDAGGEIVSVLTTPVGDTTTSLEPLEGCTIHEIKDKKLAISVKNDPNKFHFDAETEKFERKPKKDK